MRMKDILSGVFVLVLASLPHIYMGLDFTLLLIPAVSLVLMRFLGENTKYSLALLFLLSLFFSSLLIYGASSRYEFFGVLSYMFFVSLVLVVYTERLLAKKGS